LARHGLVKKRRRRRPSQHPGVVPPVTHSPNDLWAADFKGQFRTGDRIYCYPLTVTDHHTRFLLACHGLLSTRGVGVSSTGLKRCLKNLSREFEKAGGVGNGFVC